MSHYQALVKNIYEGSISTGAIGSAARSLGAGGVGDVWEIDSTLVAKIYRLRAHDRLYSISANEVLENDIVTFQLIATSVSDSPLPRMHAYEVVKKAEVVDDVCGWVVLDKIPGQTFSFDKIQKLSKEAQFTWVEAIVNANVKFESALASVTSPPDFWNRSYASARLSEIRTLIPNVSTEDLRVADFIEHVLKDNVDGTQGIFGHGDISLGNCLGDAKTVRLIDPFIRRDPPESWMRQLTFLPELADSCRVEYQKQTGFGSSDIVMWCYGALTHHHRYLIAATKSEITSARCLELQAKRDQCFERMGAHGRRMKI